MQVTGMIKCVLFDWGDTVMRDYPEFRGPMYQWPEVAAMPGAFEVITAIRQLRQVILATNAVDSGEEHIWMALNRVSLDKVFHKVYCFQKIGKLKPARGFFQYILADLMVAPENVLMVGDNFTTDIVGANRCDIFGIWINHESSICRKGKMFNTIFSLDELPDAISSREKELT
jgi:FMN phosphatase YigB (HAD superfamily)